MPQELRILVAEESEECRTLLKYQLRDLHRPISFIEATTDAEAREAIKSERPDLVITELMLGVGFRAGIQLVADTRKTFPLLPIIVLTTQVMKGVRETTFEQGASAFIDKPPRDRNEPMATVRRYFPALQ